MSRNLRRRLQRKKIIRRRIKRIVTVLIIVLIVILSLIAWRRYADNGYTMDGILGGRSEMSISEMEEALQDAVNESMFRVKVNQNPILNKDTGATSITVQNSIENRFNKVVRYYNSEGTVCTKPVNCIQEVMSCLQCLMGIGK